MTSGTARRLLKGELRVYRWIERLSQDYHGGYRNFYEIPDGFYLAPAGYETLRIVWPLNHRDCILSADAAGIVATMFALSALCQAAREDALIDRCDALHQFAKQRPEAGAILAALD